MSNSFVKRAPEIAEEILLKASDSRLPGDLKAFSKSLLNKEASDDREKLVAPARMSLADLQKVAHENKTVLPSVTVSSVDDWADTVASLTKVAADHDAANAREIFENAAALVATKEAAARGLNLKVKAKGPGWGGGGGPTPPPAAAAPSVSAALPGSPSAVLPAAKRPARGPRPAPAGAGAPSSKPSPSGAERVGGWTRFKAWAGNREAQHTVKMRDLHHGVEESKMRSKMPKTPEEMERAAERSTAEVASERRHELAGAGLRQAPFMAAAIGVPATAIAMRRDPAKKEEVKIYK